MTGPCHMCLHLCCNHQNYKCLCLCHCFDEIHTCMYVCSDSIVKNNAAKTADVGQKISRAKNCTNEDHLNIIEGINVKI